MNFESKKNNLQNLSESSLSRKDDIIDLKPESLQKELLYFKEEALKEIKLIEKNLIQKSQEANDKLKESLSTFDIRINLIKDNMLSLSNQVVEANKRDEKIENLYKLKDEFLEWTGTNKIKISLLEKDTRDSIDRINELLKNSIIYPGVIGNKTKFNNFHDFIDFLLSESKENSAFRLQNITDITNFKLKVDKNVQTLAFKVDTSFNRSKAFAENKIKEVENKVDYTIGNYKKNLDEVKIENSDYVIKLEKDTKDLREEIKNIKIIKNEIITKIDNEEQKIKNENEKIMDNFKIFREEIDTLKNDIARIDTTIEKIIQEKIGNLFESQKRSNKNLEKFKNIYNENKNDLESKINDIKTNIKEEKSQLIHSIEEIKVKLNKININDIHQAITELNNRIKNENNNINNVVNNEVLNKEKTLLNEKPSLNNSITKGKINSRNINMKNLLNNSNTVNVNKINLKGNFKRTEMENEQIINNNYNLNGNFITQNQNSIFDNINNTLNKKFLENLKINKILKLSRNQSNTPNNINAYILNPSLSSQTKSSIENNLNNKKISPLIGSKIVIKGKNKFKIEEEKGYNYNNHIRLLNSKTNKINKRLSFNNEKIQVLRNFQKLLKININDVDAKLNDFNNNNSTASFKILNENKEIYDRFYFSNSKRELNIDENYLNNKNSNSNTNRNNNLNNANFLNIYSKSLDKNTNDDYLNNKNKIEAKTLSYFYHLDPNKKINKDSVIRPDSQNIIKFKRNNKLGLYKNPNSEVINMKEKANKKFIGSNSLMRYHNYFIGFSDNDFFENKRKMKKKKYKSLSNCNKFFDDIKENNKKAKYIFRNKNK